MLEISDCSRAEIARAVRLLLGLTNFAAHHLDSLLFALRWYEAGMDFADALHLAMSAQDEALITFDRGLVKVARQVGAFPEFREA